MFINMIFFFLQLFFNLNNLNQGRLDPAVMCILVFPVGPPGLSTVPVTQLLPSHWP